MLLTFTDWPRVASSAWSCGETTNRFGGGGSGLLTIRLRSPVHASEAEILPTLAVRGRLRNFYRFSRIKLGDDLLLAWSLQPGGQVTRGCDMRGKQGLVRRGSVVLSAAALLAVGLFPGAADAVTTTSGDASAGKCTMDLGSVTAGGDHRSQRITANSPPTRTNDRVVAPGLFDDQVRLSGSMFTSPTPGGVYVAGHVIIGGTLTYSGYTLVEGRELDPDSIGREVDPGEYSDIVAFEESRYREGTSARTKLYGLNRGGVLFRWTSTSGGWSVTGTSTGFASVKAMTLISKTRTYDTFLANTRGGALYTIHIPTTSPMKPIVKPVRTRTWQGFEFLIAQKCGNQGTLLLGIDKDTQSAYLYAVGHANGTATVIQGLGKVPGTFNDPAYFRWASATNDPLAGE